MNRLTKHQIFKILFCLVTIILLTIVGGTTFLLSSSGDTATLLPTASQWEYLVYEESTDGLAAQAPNGWLDGSDGLVWEKANAPFAAPGSGNGMKVTAFNYSYFSAFLRTSFTVEDLSDILAFEMTVIFDENPTIYLNGELLWAAQGYYDADYMTVNLNDKISLLKEGTNTICVSFSNVYGGALFDMGLQIYDLVVDDNGYALFSSATHEGFGLYPHPLNWPKNILDGDASTVSGLDWLGSPMSLTAWFKGPVEVTSVYVQCKNEGNTTHTDGITRGTYDLYAVNGNTETQLNPAPIPARTDVDGGYSLELDEPVVADAIKIVITSWQANTWACVADVKVTAQKAQTGTDSTEKEGEGEKNKRFDVNKDYFVSISDVTNLLTYLSSKNEGDDESGRSEDVENNGSITISDVTALLSHLSNTKNTAVYSDGLEYLLSNDGTFYTVCGMGTCTESELIIPGEFNGLPVKVIGEGAFEGQTEINKLFIHQGIEELHESAFDSCTLLAEVNLPTTLKSLEYYAFHKCSSLTDIILPQSLERADTYVFYNCPQLTDIWCEFEELEGSTDWKFTNNYDTAAIRLSNTWTYQNGVPVSTVPAFSGTEGVLYSLGDDCKSYEVVGVDSDCTATDIVISPTYNGLYVTSIDRFAFEYYYASDLKLTSISIPEGIVQIKHHAFEDQNLLKSLHLPASVTSVLDYAFVGCSGLESITVSQDNPKYYSDQNCLMEGTTLILGCQNSVIPKNTVKIANGAFYNCVNLTNVDFPKGLVQIGKPIEHDEDGKGDYIFYGSFENCAGLTSIIMPESVTIIADKAFAGCSNIREIFCESSYYPTGWVTASPIGAWNQNCPASLYFKDFWTYVEGIPALIDPIVSEGASSGLLYAKTKDGTAYAIVGSGSCTDTEIILPSSCNGLPVTAITSGAFRDHTKITGIIIPNSITTLGDSVFQGCTALAKITIPESVTSIGTYAFLNCTRLTELVLPKSITSIAADAFRNCSALTKITIPEGVTSIGAYAFYGCTSLTEIVISDSVISMGFWAFIDIPAEATIYCMATAIPSEWDYNWNWSDATVLWGDWWEYIDGVPTPKKLVEPGYSEGLKYINHGDTYNISGIGHCTDSKILISPTYCGVSITSIGYEAFSNQTSITEIVIPDTITSVSSYAFDGCTNLTVIYCEAAAQPSGWSSKWLYNCDATVYWGGQWEYVDGVPTPIK